MPKFFDDWMNTYKKEDRHDNVDYIEMLITDYDRCMLTNEMDNYFNKNRNHCYNVLLKGYRPKKGKRYIFKKSETNGLVIGEYSGSVVECYCYNKINLEKEITEDEIAKTRYMESWWRLREEVK